MNLKIDLPWRTTFPASRRVRGLLGHTLNSEDRKVLVDQINRFEDEIRVALRSTTTAVTIGLIVLTLGVSVVKDVSRDIGLLVLFPLLSLVATVHSQAAADVAVMAEVRDRLAVIVNRDRAYPLLNVRLISDVRRFAIGTVGVNIVLGLSVAGAGFAMLRYAWERQHDAPPRFWPQTYFWVMLVLILLSVAAVALAIADIDRGRQLIYKHLDDVFGCDTRPDHLKDLPHLACSAELTPKLTACPYYKPPAVA